MGWFMRLRFMSVRFMRVDHEGGSLQSDKVFMTSTVCERS